MYCLFCVIFCIVCVYMCTVLLPPGGYPIAVEYIIYHIISDKNLRFKILTTVNFIVRGGSFYDAVCNSDNTELIYGNKVKVTLFLFTTWRHTGGVEVHLHSFLTSALHGGVWLTSNPNRFTPTGGWVDNCAGLDVLEKRKIPCPYRDSNPQPSSP
jgi:hypothetical protein